MSGGREKPELLDEIWLHIWHEDLAHDVVLLPALHKRPDHRADVRGMTRRMLQLEHVCHAWERLALTRAWRPIYNALSDVPLSPGRSDEWHRLAAINFAAGRAARPDYLTLTRACPPPALPVGGGLVSMVLPACILNKTGVDWTYVHENAAGELVPFSWGAPRTALWQKVKTVHRKKFNGGDGAAVQKAWETWKLRKREAQERARVMREVR